MIPMDHPEVISKKLQVSATDPPILMLAARQGIGQGPKLRDSQYSRCRFSTWDDPNCLMFG